MPWELATWWHVGGAALLLTVLSVGLRRLNPVALFLFGGVSVLAWSIWAINAFAVVQTTQTGVEVTHSFPSLGYLGFLLAAIMAIDLIVAVLSAMGVDVFAAVGLGGDSRAT